MKYLASLVLAAVAALIPPAVGPAVVQGAVLDRATFVITRGSEVVGREEYVLRRGRQSGGPGFTLTANSYYPADRSAAILASTLEFGLDTMLAAARLDLDSEDRPSTLISFSPRRVTIRTVTPHGESARQFPATDRTLVLDEFLIATFAILPGGSEGELTLIDARAGQRNVATLNDHGVEMTDVRGIERSLRHVTLSTGAELRHLWYDDQGRLIKFDFPSTVLAAVRLPKD